MDRPLRVETERKCCNVRIAPVSININVVHKRFVRSAHEVVSMRIKFSDCFPVLFKKVSFLAMLSFALSTQAAVEPYQPYSCPSAGAASSCQKSCSKAEVTFEFLVNPSGSVVLLRHVQAGKVINTFSLENCKIIDSDNWICGVSQSGPGGFEIKQSMTSGQYIVTDVTPDGSRPNSYLCAKKREWLNIFN